MPYLVATRNFIQNGAVQIKDLWPSISQRNLVNDPQGTGPVYVHAWSYGDLPQLRNTSTTTSFVKDCVGLTGYLMKNIQVVQDDGDGGTEQRGTTAGLTDTLTVAEATKLAKRIFDFVALGNDLNTNDINNILEDEVIDNGVNQSVFGEEISESTGVLSDIIRIVAGEKYLIPAGTVIQTIVLDGEETFYSFTVDIASSAGFLPKTCLSLIQGDSSWEQSLAGGDLLGFTTLTSYAGQSTATYVDFYGDTNNTEIGIVAIYDEVTGDKLA